MSNPFVGEIRMFGGNFPPAGWALCNGQLMPISENETLFQLIGTTYGGDGQSTFGLPNLASRVPIHAGTGPSGTTYQVGQIGGVEQVTLNSNQIPSHSHQLYVSGDPGTSTAPAGQMVGANPTVNMFRPGNPTTAMHATAVDPSGGSQPHSNMQPYLAINFIISLFGIFPQQS